MPHPALKAEIMRALGRLVRGLSALFWGIPLALLICVNTATSEWLKPIGILGPILVTSLLYYGLTQLGAFQKQERVWRVALDRAKILALINIGLSPFLYWWNRLPNVPLYSLAVGLLVLCGFLFLYNLNYLLQRLAAMLPDETLRIETKFFTSLNHSLLLLLMTLTSIYLTLVQLPSLPPVMGHLLNSLELFRQWLMIFFVLLPVAMTMTLIWKIKEVVFSSVFEGSA